jgi:hypothetical protein
MKPYCNDDNEIAFWNQLGFSRWTAYSEPIRDLARLTDLSTD